MLKSKLTVQNLWFKLALQNSWFEARGSKLEFGKSWLSFSALTLLGCTEEKKRRDCRLVTLVNIGGSKRQDYTLGWWDCIGGSKHQENIVAMLDCRLD